MLLTWTDTAGKAGSQPVPAHITPYIEAIGLDKTIAFFLAFGGAPIYLTGSPRDESMILSVLTRDEVVRLASRFPVGILQVPIPAKFIARALRAKGAGTFDIARQLRRNHTTINTYLRAAPVEVLAA